ncbi:L-aspartate oxidase [Leucobacter aridicollis]|uniref:L-aspartate oxidase n=1 Tax=Leucobacter aridicollis TaxID=283878 RepID=A0A852QZ40_9MICO|nr:FAD-binding protein [Leucobacter aridicollis]MBL3683770.1 FAD-binding protein [Leucobacter aridicollis]NYD26621.1 L-aspartate oxidase [Leucobacter aridicollis]
MILVVGAGVAGLSCALAAVARGADVVLATPGRLRDGGNTALAQGGIAAAVGPGDTAEAHLADTLSAGAGIVNTAAARVLTTEGARIVRELLDAGLPVDRASDGSVSLGLEGAHGLPRILHSGGDRTGAALHAFLADCALAEEAAGRLQLREEVAVASLIVEAGQVVGARLRPATAQSGLPAPSGPLAQSGPSAPFTAAAATAPADATEQRADAVVLATGGYAAMFPRTTNHAGARGEGILIAARAGALVADLEFVQFHPTALETGELVSEAVRGAGAVLRDAAGRRFMQDRHPLAELAPRDVVAREIHRVARAGGAAGPGLGANALGAVFLDATPIERERGAGSLARMFPGISAALAAHGHDWTREPVPVTPAAHYTMGGVASDTLGRSTLPGLFVAGEAASTGVHGANRLASNSLLEGLVFGERAGAAAAAFAASGHQDWGVTAADLGVRLAAEPVRRPGDPARGGAGAAERIADGTAEGAAEGAVGGATDVSGVTDAIAAALGIERDAAGLAAAARVFHREASRGSDLAEFAGLVCAAARARTESRGAHQRADYPATDPDWGGRRALVLEAAREPVAVG